MDGGPRLPREQWRQSDVSRPSRQVHSGTDKGNNSWIGATGFRVRSIYRSVFVLLTSSSSAFSLLGVGASSFQSPHSPVVCFSIPPFFFMSFLITSLHLSFGLPIFQCQPTFIFSLLYLLQSFSPYGLTISV